MFWMLAGSAPEKPAIENDAGLPLNPLRMS